ncbi:MAG TPA: helix-turn-helix domain-containing protein, partial [Burkholderiales bacterium]|nr:helix-turn-helix domain-containing protein [Burkholderiales bacterium]
KLSVAQVRAIEADDHSHLPSAVFVRGFIRTYARLLKVDLAPFLPAAAVMEKADERLMHRTPGVPLEPNRYRRMPMLLAGVMFVLLGLTYYEFVLNTPPAPFHVASTAPVLVLPSAASVDNSGAMVTPVAADETPPLPAPSENLALKKSVDPASGGNEKGLYFLFNGESWVEVRDGDGKIVFSRVNAPGSERIVRGDPPFSVVIGSASGVELSYNGSRVNLASYVTEDVARLRLE